ncbi:MAG TPA: HPr(Ser) kinase/phosphatase [Candidatus Hydrogenedentes bacterium]|nr:HPr(Ser) kinase/phosphatase [Candidatus Hydrogenedentota bacterium]HPG69818.1 HPr(Ser) kinase/phosphatase [Candidatus Hydrogenedentota bacterium]
MDTHNLPVRRRRNISVARLLDRKGGDLELEVLAGHHGFGRPVQTQDINRPGLALSGYLDYFANDRIQILGNTETHYMERLRTSVLQSRLEGMFSFEIPVFVLSRHLTPRNLFLDMCNRQGVPVLRSKSSTDEVIAEIILFLADEFAPETTTHGTALDCYGVGVLLVGAPGIGKSETALELIERGHRLVADDVVALRRGRGDSLFAETNSVIEYHMEIRGVGIIDVRSVFGVGRVLKSMPISLVVQLEEWQEGVDYDRTGLNEEYVTILGIRLPYLVIPVRPGRNIAIIVEVAALNHRMKQLGENAAALLNDRLLTMMNQR